MKQLAGAFLLIAGIMPAPPTIARTPQISGAKAIFALHDPNERLPNTKIRFAGSIRIGQNYFRIYDLSFTNPVSRHGMQRVAIVMNGQRFLGSYQTDGQTISVRGRDIFSSPDSFCETKTAIRLNGPRLAQQVMFACDLRDLENTI